MQVQCQVHIEAHFQSSILCEAHNRCGLSALSSLDLALAESQNADCVTFDLRI